MPLPTSEKIKQHETETDEDTNDSYNDSSTSD